MISAELGHTDDKFNIEVIPFHFDVPNHSLPLNQFLDTAKNAEEIIKCFNTEIFSDQLKYKIMVRPSEKGGLIEVLQLIVLGGAPVWLFLNSDIGKGYVKGLTGHNPEYWAEKAGESTANYLQDDNSGQMKQVTDDTEEKASTEDNTQLVPIKEEVPKIETKRLSVTQKKITSVVITQMTLGFLQKKTTEIEKIGLTRAKFRDAFNARNKIYKDCLDNKDVQSLGFDFSHDFPIKRKEFPEFIVDVPEEPEEEETVNWAVEIADIKVNSPNWKREGRKWQAELSGEKEVWFTIDDDAFWHHVKIKDIQPDINDNMKVQWAYPEDSNRNNVKVLKVLTYNGRELSKELSANEIAKELGLFSIVEDNQRDLFTRHEAS